MTFPEKPKNPAKALEELSQWSAPELVCLAAKKVAAACGPRHLRLLAVIVSIVLAVCAGTIGYARSTSSAVAADARNRGDALEVRVRLVEQAEAANAARFVAIAESLHRLEAR